MIEKIVVCATFVPLCYMLVRLVFDIAEIIELRKEKKRK